MKGTVCEFNLKIVNKSNYPRLKNHYPISYGYPVVTRTLPLKNNNLSYLEKYTKI